MCFSMASATPASSLEAVPKSAASLARSTAFATWTPIAAACIQSARFFAQPCKFPGATCIYDHRRWKPPKPVLLPLWYPGAMTKQESRKLFRRSLQKLSLSNADQPSVEDDQSTELLQASMRVRTSYIFYSEKHAVVASVPRESESDEPQALFSLTKAS